MPADAAPAATDRPEPSGPADVARREAGVTVPPPRSAPAVEADPAPPTGERTAPAAEQPTVVEDDEPAGDGANGAAPDARPGELTERERRILDFEQRWWKHAGAKEQAIRDTFGLSATRYYQLLNTLLDHPAALAAEPVLIGRLRRLRSSRARNRRR
ncbi:MULTISPECIES: DUF3263 domain-containing protein [Micromonospora]|uniref:DUF3263 domain-containing protein n=1 Tax=Micromonospora solifontis TaxID=2487138 RepID=A0ABX9WE22_9ACTN|nr:MULTISPECIES: DUF3263 domain-containing protein [Micromonospora]NES16726.1 DUF3263 domain-containing protein [Micromonospora sp. PPF5-17B]NES37706.1 DUF3263 domain-containing protein [Micromonospora solifontis]NES58444.1 DUF3263 domain-containing protein [Micromonospora sp. PPF5-6]RNL98052.1 DUF3263 domain-containing protein [Micromonospora solifontis]